MFTSGRRRCYPEGGRKVLVHEAVEEGVEAGGGHREDVGEDVDKEVIPEQYTQSGITGMILKR